MAEITSRFSEHELAIITLLQHLYDWVPGPKIAWFAAEPGAQVVLEQRCLACDGEGKRRQRGILQRCDRCKGSGVERVDAYTGLRLVAKADVGEIDKGVAGALLEQVLADLQYERDETERRDGSIREKRALKRDRSIRQLEARERVRAGLEASLEGDALLAAIERRDRQYEAGDYARLQRGLERLRGADRGGYDAVVTAYVLNDGVRRIGQGLRRRADMGVRFVAQAVPPAVRVPAYLRGSPSEELRRSLWHGRTGMHGRRRAAREAEIARLFYEEGVSTTKLADRFQLSRRRVQQIVAARPLAAAGAVATGTAAA